MRSIKWFDYLAFALLVLIIILIPFIFCLYYDTPDDPRYIFLCSGSYTDKPCYELVYVGTLIGRLNVTLYNSFPAIEWYSVFYFTMSILAFVTMALLCLGKMKDAVCKYSVLILLTVIHIYLTLHPQFTMLATELGFASFHVMLFANANKKVYLWGIFLFFLGVQMRFAAVFIPYMIAFPLFLMNFSLKDKSFWLERSWLVGLLVVSFITLFADRITYSSDQWQSFIRYNSARQFIADNPCGDLLEGEIHDEEDRLAYELFYHYRLFDHKILTIEKIENYKRQLESKTWMTIRHNIRPYLLAYNDMGGKILLLLCLMLMVELVRHKKWMCLTILVSMVSMFLLANIYMMSTSYIKDRVALFSFVSLFMGIVYMSFYNIRYFRYVFFFMCFYFCCSYAKKDYDAAMVSLHERPLIDETERMLTQSKCSRVFLPTYTELTLEVFHTKESPIGKKGIIQGWMHIYPKLPPKYKSFTAFTDGLPLLVKKEDAGQIALIQRLLYLHYKKKTKAVILRQSRHYYFMKISDYSIEGTVL